MTTKQRARVILIDEQQRVLLILVNDRQPIHIEYPNHIQFWITPGGGAEPGETPEVTAIRELAEETGIQITSVGEPIWTFSRKLRFPNGDLVTFEEVFFVVHVHSPIIQTEQMDESEHYSLTLRSQFQGFQLLKFTESVLKSMNIDSLAQGKVIQMG